MQSPNGSRRSNPMALGGTQRRMERVIPTHFKLRTQPQPPPAFAEIVSDYLPIRSMESAAYHGERLCVDADCALAIWRSTVGTASCNGTARLFGSE